MNMNVLWFKRDLRIDDNLALWRCSQKGPFLAVYVYEPRIMASPEYGSNQHEFINETLASLEEQLQAIDGWLLRLHSPIVDALALLHDRLHFTELHSSMETGNALTFARDKVVQVWCDRHKVKWRQAPTSDIFRPHPERDGWSKRWHQRSLSNLVPAPSALSMPPAELFPESVAPISWKSLSLDTPSVGRQVGGHSEAEQLLLRFLRDKSGQYPTAMSSPGPAFTACSRLSPHLAVGALSTKQVMHRIRGAKRLVTAKHIRKSYDAFESRLVWRGHFMQRLEDRVDLEQNCLDPLVENLRGAGSRHLNQVLTEVEVQNRYHSWCAGKTGFPMVDACVRSLQGTGWLNFRMRAMIVSVACYSLWLDWRQINAWLARQFTDYEPGIHLNQLQMQSGSTAMNALRIYNPITQARKHDPTETFMRQWLPELRDAPEGLLHHLGLPGQKPRDYGLDYPEPLVNHKHAERFALRTLRALRQQPESRRASRRNHSQLGSRKNRGPQMRRR